MRGFQKCWLAAMAISMMLWVASCAGVHPASMTVAEIQAASDGTAVVADVYIVQQLSDDRYLLRDSTGEIAADIGRAIMGEVQFSPDTRLRVYGEVHRDKHRSVLDVERVQVRD